MTHREATPFELLLNGHPNHHQLREVFSRHYFTNNKNIVHKAIVERVIAGDVGVIVTTNYDNCIENALDAKGLKYYRVIKESDVSGWDRNSLLIFKIHGCVSRTDSLIITLKQETRLPSWKHQLLIDLVKGNDLRIAGYSGLDFDICPVLFSVKAKPNSVFWLHRPGSDAMPNAKRAESLDKAELFISDFNGIFSLSEDLKFGGEERRSLIEDIFHGLDSDAINRWKFDLYNNLSLGRYMQSQIDTYIDSCKGTYYSQLSCIDERKGKYISGVKHLDIARKEFDNDKDKFGAFLTTIGRCYTGGFYKNGAIRLLIAQTMLLLKKTNIDEGTRAALDYLLALYIIGVSRKYSAVRNPLINSSIRLLNRASKAYAELGDWGGLYLCKVQAENLGRKLEFDSDTGILATDDGFSHLNNVVGIITSRRSLDPDYYGNIQNAYRDIRKLLYFMLYPAILLIAESALTRLWDRNDYRFMRIGVACFKSLKECELSKERRLELEKAANKFNACR